MDDVKSLLSSKTVWAGLIGVAVSLLGLGLSLEEQGTLADVAVQIATALTSAAAIYGRHRATKRIG